MGCERNTCTNANKEFDNVAYPCCMSRMAMSSLKKDNKRANGTTRTVKKQGWQGGTKEGKRQEVEMIEENLRKERCERQELLTDQLDR